MVLTQRLPSSPQLPWDVSGAFERPSTLFFIFIVTVIPSSASSSFSYLNCPMPMIAAPLVAGKPPEIWFLYIITTQFFYEIGLRTWFGRLSQIYSELYQVLTLNGHLNSPAHDDDEFRCPKGKTEISGFVQHLESRGCGLAKKGSMWWDWPERKCAGNAEKFAPSWYLRIVGYFALYTFLVHSFLRLGSDPSLTPHAGICRKSKSNMYSGDILVIIIVIGIIIVSSCPWWWYVAIRQKPKLKIKHIWVVGIEWLEFEGVG